MFCYHDLRRGQALRTSRPRARKEIECSEQYLGVSRDPIHC